MKKLAKLIMTALLCLSMLAGCTTGRKTVTTTVYPVYYLVGKLAGTRVDIDYLSSDDYIGRAQIVSNYQDIIDKTDLLIYINGLEPYLDIYYNDIQEKQFNIIDLASLSAIDDFARYTTTTVNGVSVTKESRYYDSSLFDLTDLYKKDPFIWLDPIAMSSMASTINDWLCQQYPENALVFDSNFEALQAELIRMDDEYQSLNTRNDIKLVTVTPSFGNWQKNYGIQLYPLILSKYGVLPTASQLVFIEQAIKDAGVKYIVHDRTLPDDMQNLYEQVKTDLGLQAVELSSLTRLSSDDVDKSKDYMTIMYENLTNLENAFK